MDRVKQRACRWAAGLLGFLGRRAAGVASSQRGATTAEYAMILALVVIVLITSLGALGRALDGKLGEIIEALNAAGQQP